MDLEIIIISTIVLYIVKNKWKVSKKNELVKVKWCGLSEDIAKYVGQSCKIAQKTYLLFEILQFKKGPKLGSFLN